MPENDPQEGLRRPTVGADRSGRRLPDVWKAFRFVLKYLIMMQLCHIAFHSLVRIPAISLLTGGLIDQADQVEAGTSSTLRNLAVFAFLAIALCSDALAVLARRRNSRGLRRASRALPIGFFAATLPFFLPQVLFPVILEKLAILTIFGPLLVIVLLLARKKMSISFAVALAMFTIGLNFGSYVKSNRGVSSEELVEIVSQEHLRPLVLTPSRESPELAVFRQLPGLDVQDVLIGPAERYLYASTGINYEDPDLVRTCPLVRIDLQTGEMDRIPISTGFRPMVIDEARNRLYLGTDLTEAVVVEIDLENFTELSRRQALQLGKMAALELFYLDAQRDVLWIFHEWGTIERWSVGPLRRTASFSGYGMHEFLHIEGTDDVFFQSECAPPGLMRYRLDGEPVLTGKRTLPLTYGLTYRPASRSILMSDPILGRVWEVDPATLAVLGSFDATFGAKNIVYDARRDMVYVGNYLSGFFHAYDGTTGVELGRIYVGKRFRRIALAPESGRVFANTARGVFEVDVEAVAAR